MSKPMTPEEQKRRQKKTKSVRSLAENIHKLRRKVTTDLKSDNPKTQLAALAVAIMDKTAERVGNEASAKDGHVGVTGFQNKHITIDGNTVHLKYVGKSGVDHEKQFTDKTIAKLLKQCKDRCDSEKSPLLVTEDGFKIKADKVNRYLRDFGVTAKDIRGYAANTLVTKMLSNANVSRDKDERKKKFREVLKSVAEKVGHQQATLKQHYLLPGLESEYVGKGKIPNVKNASDKNLIEDIRIPTSAEEKIKEVLSHYSGQHEYAGSSWDGIEKLHYMLASVTDSLAIESAGWYRYPSSLRGDMDGKDWRLVIPAMEMPVVVNCHSLLHDGCWTLTTTTYSTREASMSPLNFIGFQDPWIRSMMWSIALAQTLESDGYDYTEAIDEMRLRLLVVSEAWGIYDIWKPFIEKQFRLLFNEESDMPDVMTIAINDWNLRPEKIASYKWPGNLPWGCITISPSAFRSKKLLTTVIKHELCHAVIGPDEKPHHNKKFKILANAIGIPEEYQD